VAGGLESAAKREEEHTMSDALTTLSAHGVSIWLGDLNRDGWCRAASPAWSPTTAWWE
jgi:hypothetical protein